MITRGFGHGGYAAACAGNPPPLHVYDTESEAANWHPLPRPFLRATPPGPQMIRIPVPAPYGDDPVDKANQTMPRVKTNGMVARLNMGVTV